jgi:hypothetical protein
MDGAPIAPSWIGKILLFLQTPGKRVSLQPVISFPCRRAKTSSEHESDMKLKSLPQNVPLVPFANPIFALTMVQFRQLL